MSLQAAIEFIQEVDKLKKVLRKTYNYHEKRCENSAEHSWHLALGVLSFQKFANQDIDLLRALKMALLHDVVEIDAGDQIVYAHDPDKYDRELKAAERIFSLLPKEMGDEFLKLWKEFEAKDCPESKYVGALDRFLPMMSNCLNEGLTWKEHGISYEQVLDTNKNAILSGAEEIWPVAEKMLEESVQCGDLQKR